MSLLAVWGCGGLRPLQTSPQQLSLEPGRQYFHCVEQRLNYHRPGKPCERTRARLLWLAQGEYGNYDLGKENGFDLLPGILNAAPNTRVIVLTSVRDLAAHERIVILGALGIVLKETALELILKAIEKVCVPDNACLHPE